MPKMYNTPGRPDIFGRSLQQHTVTASPYIAKGPISNLTPKEQRARREKVAYAGGNTIISEQTQFFSPQLSTDFLELPQSLREKREIYRHFYNTDPIVGQAIDLHTELPLSKVRLAMPKPTTCPEGFKDAHDYASYILWFFTQMCEKIKLFQRLVTVVHHYWLDGGCVTADTLVTTQRGEIPASRIKLSDKLLSHTGVWRSIEAAHIHKGSGLLSINAARLPDPLKLTDEHPIEVYKDGVFEFIPAGEIRRGDFVRLSYPSIKEDFEKVDFRTSHVEECEGGYRIRRSQKHKRAESSATAREGLLRWLGSISEPTLMSRRDLAESFGVSLVTLNNVILTLDKELPEFRRRVASGPRNGPHTLWFPLQESYEHEISSHYTINRNFLFTAPLELPLNEDLLYLIGYWLGDGTLTRDSSRDTWGRGKWSICFGSESKDQITKVTQILHGFFGVDAVSEYLDSRGVLNVSLSHNPAFVEWWSSQFGCTSTGPSPKRVPNWLLHLPPEKQLHLIAGLVDSDGCVSGGVVSLSLCSPGLIHRIRDIFLRCGAVPSFRVDTTPRSNELNGHTIEKKEPSYALTVTNFEEAGRLVTHAIKASRLSATPKHQTHNSYIKTDSGEIAVLVRGVEALPDEMVYNFQVETDSTFRANFISTHNCFIFAEDSEVELPDDVGYTKSQIGVKSIVTSDGDAVEAPEYGYTENADKDDEELAFYQKEYLGWEKLIVLPIDQVKVSTYSFTDTMRIEMIPAERDRALIEQAKAGDEFAMQVVQEIPEEVRSYLEEGRLIPLGTDPDEGSFCYYLAGRRGAEEELGQSILDRVLRTLMYREKLRQAQTQIASRAMTPKRLVWADRISAADVEDLREQVDLALVDPDYSIITNYEVRWEEMGARDRLLDLSSEYDITDRQLYAGLGVTESLLSGEAMYSGDRLKLEVINTRYLFLREMVQEYVENYLFKPIARRKGFVEKNAWGGEVVIYPKLSFTRLPLRDSQDTYDALFNLYQKGSIDIGVILEMFNIDPDDTKQRLEKDLFTVNDAMFNEVVRGIYNEAGTKLTESSDVIEKIADALKITYTKPVESDDRF